MTRLRSPSPAHRACMPYFTFAAIALTTLMLIPSHLSARSLSGNHFIVGGQSENRYPAVGAIIEGNEASCTGTLITPTYVLT